MGRYIIEYTATTKYSVEFTADSAEDAKLQAESVLHPLQLDDSVQQWLEEYDEEWDTDEIGKVG
jgi:hypothetical protein